ncbi:hypothetical protein I2W78_15680 [Streptomyces spinoverrucosus]|uniref:hypothetical protein n=1 Tax=Streptomyces spinoverrucosus TaxID=284043 RepID=UPI0018C363CF|nr:hypothetical protein [Streptomyces spinoverrucosus]MBG0853246.1 hypothetical protein [Streptomyces spinoverrucosus]
MARAAREEHPPKEEILPLPVLRARWREAVALFGADIIDRLLELARRAAEMIRARVRRVLDIAVAVLDVAKTVYVHHGVFRYRHLLAEARRHVTQTSLGKRAEPGLPEQTAHQAARAHCRNLGGQSSEG